MNTNWRKPIAIPWRSDAWPGLLALRREPLALAIVFGLLLRVALLPLSAHSDMLLMNWQAFETVASGNFAIYDYAFQKHGQQVLAPVPWSPYGPAFYYTIGGWLALVRVLGLHPLTPWESPFGVAHLPRLVALVKLFYLVLEAGVVWLLCRVSDDGKPRPLVAALWLLCPFTLYTPFMMGQNDLLPVACIVASLYCGARALRSTEQRRWPLLAVAALGLGGAYKLFPLVCLPVAALLLARSTRQRLALLAVGLLPFALIVGPYLPSRVYRYSGLLNPEAAGVLERGVTLPNGVFLPALVVIYGCLLFALAQQQTPRSTTLVLGYGAALLALSLCTVPLPQFFLWLAPFLALLGARCPAIWRLASLQALFFALLLGLPTDANGLALGLFAPLSRWFAKIPSLAQLIGPIYPYANLLHVAHALYLCALLFGAWELWRGRRALAAGTAPRAGLWIVLPLGVVALLLVANLALGGNRLTVARSELTGATSAPLSAASVVAQRFQVPANLNLIDPRLACVELRLRAAEPPNMTPVRVALRDAAGAVLATSEATPSGTPADVWQPFCFSPVPVLAGADYAFSVDSPAPQGEVVVVRAQQGEGGYADGALVVDGAPEPGGADLSFRLQIALPWANVARDVTAKARDDPALYALYGLACALLAATLVAALALRLRPLTSPRRAVSSDNQRAPTFTADQ